MIEKYAAFSAFIVASIIAGFFAGRFLRRIAEVISLQETAYLIRRLACIAFFSLIFYCLVVEKGEVIFLLIFLISYKWGHIMGFERKTYSPLVVFNPKYYFQD